MKIVRRLSAAGQARSRGVGQIDSAVAPPGQTTPQNASSPEELAATAEKRSAQAEPLQQTMGFFRVTPQSAVTGSAVPVAMRKAPAPVGVSDGVDDTRFARH